MPAHPLEKSVIPEPLTVADPHRRCGKLVGILVYFDTGRMLRPHPWEEGRHLQLGSEGNDLSFRIRKLLHRNAQEGPRAAGGVKYPDARDLLGKTAQKAAEGNV